MSSRSGEAALSIRLGVVPYLNVAPIVHGLRDDARFEIVRDLPSRIAELLHAGEVDLGMIPSIEYAAGDYAIVPDIAIGSHGPVRSVCLFHRRPLEGIRRVALDSSSRTSVALLKVLLRERLGRDPEYVSMAPPIPEMLAAADAALAIGDPALYYDEPCGRLDLGDAWTQSTRLPFVFAFWAGRPGALTGSDVERLRASLRTGRAALDSIASAYNGWGAGRRNENEAYLRSNIVYDFGEAQRAGLLEFYRRACRLGLIARIPDLRFHERS